MLISRRKRIVVDSAVQWAIVRQSIVHWFMYATGCSVFFGFMQVLVGDGLHRTWGDHWREFWPSAATLFGLLAMLLPKFIYDSFKLSNRFAGPLMRLRRTLNDVAAGRPYRKLTPRSGDFWPELPGELDAAITKVLRDAQAPPQANGSLESDSLSESEVAEHVATCE